MWYGFLADCIVAFHVGYVAFIVVGLLAILIGCLLGWSWIRNPWFRLAHLAAIVVVGLEAVFGIDCPLTVWESDLRGLAGQDAAAGTFVGRILHGLIFYDVPPWILNALHVAFALLVLATLFLIPPRWPWQSPTRSRRSGQAGSPGSHAAPHSAPDQG
jgi:hypothetical protein